MNAPSTAARAVALLWAMLAAAGCTLPAARYHVAVDNTLALREAGLSKVRVGEIRKDPKARPDVDKLASRGTTLASPYGSYAAYLREALANELEHADLLDANSGLSIDGVLLRNEIRRSSEREYTELEAHLTVRRDGVVTYEGTRSARFEWESVALGGVAVSRSASNYQAGVQRLIAAFIADPAFLQALRAR